MEENQLKNSDQQKDTENILQNIEENKQKKNNMPIVISAIVVGFLFLAAIALILIFGQKAEEIKEIRVFNLGSFGYSEINSEKFDKKIIKSKSELEDFYNSLRANYTVNKTTVTKRADYYNVENLTNECDWLKDYGDEGEYEVKCLAAEEQSRDDYCFTEFNYGKVPDYCEDLLEDIKIQKPSELDDRYFTEHDLLVVFSPAWFYLTRITSLEKTGNSVKINSEYSTDYDLNYYPLSFIELDKNYLSEHDMIEIHYTRSIFDKLF